MTEFADIFAYELPATVYLAGSIGMLMGACDRGALDGPRARRDQRFRGYARLRTVRGGQPDHLRWLRVSSGEAWAGSL